MDKTNQRNSVLGGRRPFWAASTVTLCWEVLPDATGAKWDVVRGMMKNERLSKN